MTVFVAESRLHTPRIWERGFRIIEVSVNRKLTEKSFLQGTGYIYAC